MEKYIKKLNLKIKKCVEDINIKSQACAKMQKMLEVDLLKQKCLFIEYLYLPLDNIKKEELKTRILNAQKNYEISQNIFDQILIEKYVLVNQKKRLISKLTLANKLNKNFL